MVVSSAGTDFHRIFINFILPGNACAFYQYLRPEGISVQRQYTMHTTGTGVRLHKGLL